MESLIHILDGGSSQMAVSFDREALQTNNRYFFWGNAKMGANKISSKEISEGEIIIKLFRN